MLASDGNLYGTTAWGGIDNALCGNNGCGTLFRISMKGKLVSLYSFCSDSNTCQNGGVPYAGLIKGTDGTYYGTTETAGSGKHGTVYNMTPQGKVTTLFDFDGAQPAPAVIQASNGKLYGGTQSGGTENDGVLYDLTTKPPVQRDGKERGSATRPIIDPRALPLSPLGARQQ